MKELSILSVFMTLECKHCFGFEFQSSKEHLEALQKKTEINFNVFTDLLQLTPFESTFSRSKYSQ